MIRIDGSFGEGGGQILRYSAALAAATGKAVEVFNIRANRPNPGLRPQHLSSLRILKKMFGGEIEGLKIGSTQVVIRLKGPRAGSLTYDIGTAGSIPLVIQSLVPALVLSDSESEIILIGGTDVKWSPTIDYIKYVYGSLIHRFGPEIDVEIVRRGYYPAGGGKVILRVCPSGALESFDLIERGRVERVLVRSVVSRLPSHIVHRQVEAIVSSLSGSSIDWLRDIMDVEKEVLGSDRAAGPGTSVLVVARHSGGLYCGGDSIGERGKSAEKVGREAFKKFLGWFVSEAVLDKYVGDMVIPFAALSIGKTVFTVPEYTGHMKSALYVVKEILDVEYHIECLGENLYRIEVGR